MKIYTRTGDKGTSTLFTGERVKKNTSFMEALGNVDECNSAIGVALSQLPLTESFYRTRQQLEMIQHALFDVGAALSTPRRSAEEGKLEKTRFGDEGTTLLEKWIDAMDAELPLLKTFILPSGHAAGASLHLARSICRRAERAVVPLYEQADVVQSVLVYLNRLSDYLFIVSRYVNYKLGIPETCWTPHKTTE
jgi:cob(I)alamin adenosyltransferase